MAQPATTSPGGLGTRTSRVPASPRQLPAARRLLGDLTVARGGALRAGCRTDAAAATALSLHLNLGPTHFELLRIDDVASDGSAIRPPTSTALHRPGYGVGSNATPQHAGAMLAGALNTPRRVGEDERAGWGEFCCREPITLPGHAWSIFAAHRAYRVGRGATDEDPFFVHPREPESRSPAPLLREAIRRSCHLLRIDPPWIHGDDCRYGGDDAHRKCPRMLTENAQLGCG